MLGIVVSVLFTLSAVSASPMRVLNITATNADIVDDLEFDGEIVDGKVIIMGDIQIDPHRNALRNSQWTNGILPYVIDSSFDSDLQDKIVVAMREIEHDVNTGSHTCIKFVPRSHQSNYIFVTPGTGCHSTIGMAGDGKQEVSLGSGCEAKGIMMHELVHAIGFWHEQNRPDRDQFVEVDLTLVDAERQKNYQLLSTSKIDTLGVEYDMGSVMHYNAYEWSNDKSIPVMKAKPGKGIGEAMGQRLALSTKDVLKIQKFYGCTVDTTHIITPLSPGNVMADCDFRSGYGICGFQDVSGGTYSWKVQSGMSPSGHPTAGHTNGIDAYMIASGTGHTGTARVATGKYNKGHVCIDFYLYQNGPSSYLDILAFGPQLYTTTVRSYKNFNHDKWYHTRVNLNVPVGSEFQLELRAHLSTGDVAIDDFHVFSGNCF